MRNVLYFNETRIQINTKFKPKVAWIFVPRKHPTLTPSEFSSGVILTRFSSISTRSSSSSLIFLILSAPHTCESSEAGKGHLRNHAGMKNTSLLACSFRLFPSFFFFVYSFVHEQSREVRGGDDSGSVRPTGSVSFRERKREETPTVSLSSHFFLERRKFRRRKPKRFHVSPPSFRFNSFSFRFVSGFCFH